MILVTISHFSTLSVKLGILQFPLFNGQRIQCLSLIYGWQSCDVDVELLTTGKGEYSLSSQFHWLVFHVNLIYRFFGLLT